MFYAPAGTVANLGATAGTTIGTLDAKAAAGALGGATLPLTGTVEARAADGTYLSSGVQVPLAAAATRCTGTATPRRLLGAEAHGGRPDARGAAVRRPGLGRARSGRVVLPDGLPAAVRHPGEPRRRRVRREGVRGELHRQGRLHGRRPGTNLWRLRATPYTPAKGTPNAPATVESQSYVETGSVALGTIKRVLTKLAASFTVAGKVTSSGAGAGASVTLAKGTSGGEAGRVLAPGGLGRGNVLVEAQRPPRRQAAARLRQGDGERAAARDLDVSECKATFGVSCISATASGFTAVSAHEGPARPEEVARGGPSPGPSL